MSDLRQHMEAVARHLLGEPNKRLSSKRELRFRSQGSLSVDLGKGTFFDHETGQGGGVLDLIARETGLANGAALAWLRNELQIEIGPEHKEASGPRRIVACYDYVDEAGDLLFQVVRYQPKDFRQRRPNGKGGWAWSLGDVRRVLYRLPDLIAADPAVLVFVTEGEKDVDRLRGLGLVATTSPQGAGKWTKCDRAALAGRHVVILPDNDQPGRQHARAIVRDLAGKAASVRVLELPELPAKGDVSDWIERGSTADELRRLAAEVPEAKPEVEAEDWRQHLICTDKGQPLALEANVVTLLSHALELRGRLRWNELACCVECRDLPWGRRKPTWRPWLDVDDAQLAVHAQRQGLRVRPTICASAVQIVAHEMHAHPVRDHLDRLAWDGTPRLDGWLTTYLGAAGEDEGQRTYLREVGRCWLIAAVARIYRPGCKVDTVLILEGPQMAKKSSTAEALAIEPAWFTDQIADLGSRDAAQDLRGKWIVELGELSAMRRSEVETIKAFLSRRIDHYRPSYGRRSEDFPRQCVFIGSTNNDTYLHDTTGGRRFWPVRVGTIDLDALRRDRDQLWAEAVAAFKAGEPWWLNRETEALAKVEQEDRREAHPWEVHVLAWLADRIEATAEQVLEQAIGLPKERQDQKHKLVVVGVLKAHGWKLTTARMPGRSTPVRVYRRPAVVDATQGQSEEPSTGPSTKNPHDCSVSGHVDGVDGVDGRVVAQESTTFDKTCRSQGFTESPSTPVYTVYPSTSPSPARCTCGAPADAPGGLCAACYWRRGGHEIGPWPDGSA